jgi:hypothetical protein
LGSQILTFQHLLRPHHGNGADLQASLQSQKIQTSWPHHAKKSDSASINFNSHIINVVHGVASPCKERRVILLLLTLILISLMWLTGWCDHPQVIQGVAGHLMELPATPVILGFFFKKKIKLIFFFFFKKNKGGNFGLISIRIHMLLPN